MIKDVIHIQIDNFDLRMGSKKAISSTGDNHSSEYKEEYSLSDVGIFLFSRAVASQVFSALQGLTSVFGMGTGGPPASSTPTVDSE